MIAPALVNLSRCSPTASDALASQSLHYIFEHAFMSLILCTCEAKMVQTRTLVLGHAFIYPYPCLTRMLWCMVSFIAFSNQCLIPQSTPPLSPIPLI